MSALPFRLTNPDRVLWPDRNLTKRDLASYYVEVAERMLPHAASRPLMLLRCPQGQTGHCFFQKHLGPSPTPGLRPVALPRGEGGESAIALDDVRGLLALAQTSALEVHGWGSRTDRLDRPDRLVFDLDPAPELPFPQVVRAALHLRLRLEALGLSSLATTTGGKGLHVHVPLRRVHGWDEVKRFARSMADLLVRERPSWYVASASKALRKGKIFVDWLRNARGATAVVPYSTRARPGAPVAMPLAWREVTVRLRPESFTVQTVARRLSRDDPWADYRALAQRIPSLEAIP